jgi:glycerol-3-phosphate dehydrogenase
VRVLDADTHVAVIGGGVVGCAVAHALARRDVKVVLLEAELGLALGASGSNSGILHTGFDATPGALETRLILRSAVLREELLDELGVTVWRCGARLSPSGEQERAAVARLAENARANGVDAHLDTDGSLTVPGETVSDPVAYVHALAGAAQAGGATIILGARVSGLATIKRGPAGRKASEGSAGARRDGMIVTLDDGERLPVGAAVNCAGLYADELARRAGDELPGVYPRKGEFLVFAAPREESLEQILLPAPSALGKGVLVFPTLDRRAVIAGPTAREREDKRDRTVESDAADLILAKARRMYPALEGLEPIGSYAGLRTAGRDANYVIERSRTLPALVHVAAIRSTGLSASLGIGEHVAAMLAESGAISPGPVRTLPTPAPWGSGERWWERAARASHKALAPSEPAAPPVSP